MSKKGKTKYDYYKRCIICDSYYIDYSGSNNKCRKHEAKTNKLCSEAGRETKADNKNNVQ